jgi:hypothetical protein
MTTLNDWNYEEYVQPSIQYRPGVGNVNFLDIWQYEVNTPF